MIEVTARLGLGILIAFDGQHAAVFRDAEDSDNAGGTIAGVEMTAIRGQMDIRRPAHAGKIRHHVQRLHAFDFFRTDLSAPRRQRSCSVR